MTGPRMVPCRMDGCTCGEPHPAYGNCNMCRGHGHVIGSDAYQSCPSCRLRFQREFGPFIDALRELPTEDQLAQEAAEDRVDVESKRPAGWRP